METKQKIEASWHEVLKDEFEKPYFINIKQKLVDDVNAWITIYPKMENIFKAFEKTPFDNVKVVILWQDPYHGPGQAQWFCFSVPEGIRQPPSLQNIFKELNASLWVKIPSSWDLTPWTNQWVFLLNASLTVQQWAPMSHAKIWWETFTDQVIKTISDKKEWIVFLLWWAFAQSKKSLIDTNKHFVLETTHPSPFSAHRWFLWSNCFKQTNQILKQNWKKEINWEI